MQKRNSLCSFPVVEKKKKKAGTCTLKRCFTVKKKDLHELFNYLQNIWYPSSENKEIQNMLWFGIIHCFNNHFLLYQIKLNTKKKKKDTATLHSR